MNNKNYFLICLAAFMLSLLLFAYHKECIILNLSTAQPIAAEPQLASKKQTITLNFWQQNSWHTEQVSLLLSDNKAANMQQVVSRWLQLLHEEKITKKKVALQSATITFDKQELIISFDRAPWNKESSTYEKWMVVEGLFKTIKAIDSSIKKVRFLVNQIPLQDPHLDFTNAWPISGFAQ